MRPQIVCLANKSRTPSSSRWLARASRDAFSRSKAAATATEHSGDNYVARSSHKLVEILRKYRQYGVRPGQTVLELGAAPGGWTQVCIRAMRGRGRIVAVDLDDLHEQVRSEAAAAMHSTAAAGSESRGMDLLHVITGDMLASHPAIERGLQGCTADVVLSDILANTTGNSLRDSQASLDLCQAVLQLAEQHGNPSRCMLVMKILQSEEAASWRRDTLSRVFDTVRWEKPEASRKESKEGYLVCLRG